MVRCSTSQISNISMQVAGWIRTLAELWSQDLPQAASTAGWRGCRVVSADGRVSLSGVASASKYDWGQGQPQPPRATASRGLLIERKASDRTSKDMQKAPGHHFLPCRNARIGLLQMR